MDTMNFHPYEIREKIAIYGITEVYEAYDRVLGRSVAIELLKDQIKTDPGFRSKFDQAAAIFARLEHPNIIPVYEYRNTSDNRYLVTRLMKGGTLSERTEDKLLSVENAVQIARQIGSGLDYIHSVGTIHNNIKSNVIFFDPTGNAYLSGFILSQSPDSTKDTDKFMGEPGTIAPEILRAESPTSRSDQFQFACLIY